MLSGLLGELREVLTGPRPDSEDLHVAQLVRKSGWVPATCRTLCPALEFNRKHSSLASARPNPSQALAPLTLRLGSPHAKPAWQRGEARDGTSPSGMTAHRVAIPTGNNGRRFVLVSVCKENQPWRFLLRLQGALCY